MFRGSVTLGFVVLVAVGVPIATADTVVDQKVTAEKGDDGAITATIKVINTGPDAVTLSPVVVPAVARCHLTPEPTAAGPSQVTSVTVTIPQECLPEVAASTSTPSSIAVDLDGVAARQTLPTTVVTLPADEPSSWAPLWWGLVIAVFMAVPVGLWGLTEHQAAEAAAMARKGRSKRRKAYLAVQAIVDTRVKALGLGDLNWTKLKAPVYTLTSPIGNLEAGWSFKDSWVANLTVASTALIALLTSTDALTAVLGEKPAAALGVMTVAGLVSAAIVGVANTVVKLVGTSVSVVTVGGLILSTALVVLAAGFQVATVGLAVAGAAGHWPLALAALLLALLVGAVLEVYAFRVLGQAVRGGFADQLPVVPADALSAWAASEEWEKHLVKAQIRIAYEEWLQPDRSKPARGSVPGMADWVPVAPPPAPEGRRRSLL
jgi:hypothetical protein